MKQKFLFEKSIFFIGLGIIILVAVFIFYLFSEKAKSLEVFFPVGGEELLIGETYEITWRSKNIEKIGIVLLEGEEPIWIARNIDANIGRYEWKVQPGQDYRKNYWIAIFEFPWQKGNPLNYPSSHFSIIYDSFDNCDSISIANEWPYLPSDFPGLRRVFITKGTYAGNLEGIEGADRICKEEAKQSGLEGEWQAFIGGDRDEETAIERLKRTQRGLGGIFIEAEPVYEMERGDTCHRLLAKDFEGFLAFFTNFTYENEKILSSSFFQKLSNLWIGRITIESAKNCVGVTILSATRASLAEQYSFTATCQSWASSQKIVRGYPVPRDEEKPDFPTCYTPEGVLTDAVSIAGLSSGIRIEESIFSYNSVKACDTRQYILCIEK